MPLLNQSDIDKAIKERLSDDKKVYLKCEQHNWYYGSKKPWNFKCKQCTYAALLGLYMSVPPHRREEMLEAIEEGIHHMIESAERGELQQMDFLKRPEVKVEKGN